MIWIFLACDMKLLSLTKFLYLWQRFFKCFAAVIFSRRIRRICTKIETIKGMIEFKSIIVLDLETTSLPELDHNTTKITELACIGCEIGHLKNSKEVPRVLHKLVLPFNPNKLVNPTTSNITGLTNELLENVKPFRKEDVEMLKEFIDRLPNPVCLVAQNGDAFDFPILRRAMVKVNKKLQNNVYCLDSLKAFRALLSPADSSVGAIPSQKRISPLKTPIPLKRTNPVNSLQHKNVSRELFPDDEDEALFALASSQEDGDSASRRPQSTQKPSSFKLNDIYKFYFGGHIAEAHRAEVDAKVLLSCIMRCQGFLEWMNENAVIFNSVEPLF